MNKIWIVVANAAQASIYAMSERDRHFSLVHQLSHEESRLKNQDLVADKSGQFHKSDSKGGSFAENISHKLLEAKHFAHEITTVLEKGRNDHNYTGLILVAEPHFHGLLNHECSGQLKSYIKHHVPKDYTQYPESKLESKIKNLLEREIGALLLS